jgi:hypothetical protein
MRFYDYTCPSWPWISTPVALILWGLFIYMVLDFRSASLNAGEDLIPDFADLTVLSIPVFVAAIFSYVAYIGWFPTARLELNLADRQIHRVPPPIQYEEASFELEMGEVSSLQVRARQVFLLQRHRDAAGRAHRKVKGMSIHDVVAQPSGQSIFASRSRGRCRRVASKVGRLLGVEVDFSA